jgi:hypothetical protein
MKRLTRRRRKNVRVATRQCPACGSRAVVPILNGFPDADAFEKADRGEVVLGGCVIVENLPHWSCRTCDHSWR